MTAEEIKKLIEELLQKIPVSFDEIEIKIAETDKNPKFIIKTKDSSILIGHKGEHFSALNHILKRIVAKKTSEDFKFSIDVNDYQENNLGMIKKKAQVIAERVKYFKTNMEMDPMSSYERMTVHALFADDVNIKTESIGEGKDRRVVIKYVDSTI